MQPNRQVFATGRTHSRIYHDHGGQREDPTYRSAARHRAQFTIAQKSYFALIGAIGAMRESAMKIMSAREAKNGFGLMIDTARAAPVLIEKHGRGVVVVMSVEEYERLKEIEAGRMGASDDPARDSASGDGRQ